MYFLTVTCDGPNQMDSAPECFTALALSAPDADSATEAIKHLQEQAGAGGWKTDRRDGRGVAFCPRCWPAWMAARDRVRRLHSSG